MPKPLAARFRDRRIPATPHSPIAEQTPTARSAARRPNPATPARSRLAIRNGTRHVMRHVTAALHARRTTRRAHRTTHAKRRLAMILEPRTTRASSSRHVPQTREPRSAITPCASNRARRLGRTRRVNSRVRPSSPTPASRGTNPAVTTAERTTATTAEATADAGNQAPDAAPQQKSPALRIRSEGLLFLAFAGGPSFAAFAKGGAFALAFYVYVVIPNPFRGEGPASNALELPSPLPLPLNSPSSLASSSRQSAALWRDEDLSSPSPCPPAFLCVLCVKS